MSPHLSLTVFGIQKAILVDTHKTSKLEFLGIKTIVTLKYIRAKKA